MYLKKSLLSLMKHALDGRKMNLLECLWKLRILICSHACAVSRPTSDYIMYACAVSGPTSDYIMYACAVSGPTSDYIMYACAVSRPTSDYIMYACAVSRPTSDYIMYACAVIILRTDYIIPGLRLAQVVHPVWIARSLPLLRVWVHTAWWVSTALSLTAWWT